MPWGHFRFRRQWFLSITNLMIFFMKKRSTDKLGSVKKIIDKTQRIVIFTD